MAASTPPNFCYKSQQRIDRVSHSMPSIILSNTSKVSNEKCVDGFSKVPTETLDVELSIISPTKKHHKWNQCETLKLIEMCMNMENWSKKEKVKVPWEEISRSLLEH